MDFFLLHLILLLLLLDNRCYVIAGQPNDPNVVSLFNGLFQLCSQFYSYLQSYRL